MESWATPTGMVLGSGAQQMVRDTRKMILHDCERIAVGGRLTDIPRLEATSNWSSKRRFVRFEIAPFGMKT
jgi:hypothetical protein